jgi:N-acetylmuramoyl-L-alanine amidase
MIRRTPPDTLFWQAVFLTAVLILAVFSSFAQENTLAILVEQDPSRNSSIGVFRHQGVVYGSLHDLTEVLALRSFENTQARKLEIKPPPDTRPAYRLVVSGGNPFLTIIDEKGRRSVYQLPHGVLYAVNSYFVPLASFLPLFNSAFHLSVVYDLHRGVIRIPAAITAQEFDITTVVMEPKFNGMLIRIPAARPLRDFESWLRDDGWLYVTIADARADINAINKLKPIGMVRKIVAIQSPASVQLTFKLAGKVDGAEILRQEDSREILVSVKTPPAEEKALSEEKRQDIQTDLATQRKRWKLDVIVIDPGHGGKDWGASGVTGLREKEVTLGIALKLGKLIERQLKGIKVVYTRKDDRFIELHRRGQIANESDGKLFISLHCNSMPRKPSPLRGFEVYLLRPGRTAEAVAIAERENAVIELEEGYERRYQKLTEENFILVTMAQSAYLKASEVFSDIAQQELERSVRLPNRGVKQAGFYVLVGASMPNVLVETAYLSNRQDEIFLKSESGQMKIAEALFKAVKRYKGEYEKILLEGKDIGFDNGGRSLHNRYGDSELITYQSPPPEAQSYRAASFGRF